MKNTKFLILLLVSTISSTGYSQNSVTLYGILDDGIQFNSNAGGSRQYYLASGVINGSRFGFQGVEDLGAGLHTIFTLENGFDVNSAKNQGGLLFGRQSFVGLSSDEYGSLTLGRQYDSSLDYVGPLTAPAQLGGYITATPGDPENFTTAWHANNAIKYTSHNYAGFKFGGLYSLGGIAGDATQNQFYSMGASYGSGPWAIAAAYDNSRNPNASYYANSIPNATSATNNLASPADHGFASGRTQQVADAAVSYSLGSFVLASEYSRIQFKDLSGVVGVLNPAGLRGTATLNNYAARVKYFINSAFSVGAQFARTVGSAVQGKDGAKYNQLDLGADYFISKRTDISFVAVYQKATGTQSNGALAVAAINGTTPSSNSRQVTCRLGLRQKF